MKNDFITNKKETNAKTPNLYPFLHTICGLETNSNKKVVVTPYFREIFPSIGFHLNNIKRVRLK